MRKKRQNKTKGFPPSKLTAISILYKNVLLQGENQNDKQRTCENIDYSIGKNIDKRQTEKYVVYNGIFVAFIFVEMDSLLKREKCNRPFGSCDYSLDLLFSKLFRWRNPFHHFLF